MPSTDLGAGYRQLVNLGDAFEVTEGDLLVIMQEQKSRILERTSRGLDYNEQPFAGYNDTRRVYWYPAGPVGKQRSPQQHKRDRNAVIRAGRTVGMSFRTKEDREKNLTRSGLGLKFKSYRAFKFEYLGRSTVDLYGPRAPHMLQSIAIKAGSMTDENAGQFATAGLDPGANVKPASEGKMGIYGEAGARASGHNSDDRPRGVPLRRFFAASDSDQTKMGETVAHRIARRLEAKIKEFSGSEAWKNDFDLGF